MTPEEIKARRTALELSQSALALRLGVDRSYVSHVERGDASVRLWYDLALRAIEYEERIRPLPRKWTKPKPETADV